MSVMCIIRATHTTHYTDYINIVYNTQSKIILEEVEFLTIIAISNQKGGTGKSTTAHAIAAGLAYRKKKILLIDMDAQGNLSYCVGAKGNDSSVYDVLTGKTPLIEAIRQTQQKGNFDFIQASSQLSTLDIQLTQVGKEYKLKESLEIVKKNYHYIIIDTPPSLGIVTINALVAAENVIIPAQADVFSIQGIGQFYNTFSAVKQYCNPSLKISGILITRYSSRSILSRDFLSMTQETAERMGTKIYKATIRECIAIKEAQAKKQDIFSYAKKSNAAQDYGNLIAEILKGD